MAWRWCRKGLGRRTEGRGYGQSGQHEKEAAWLFDWNGKKLKTVMTDSYNTSGMTFGNGHVWMGANGGPEGIYEVDMNGNTVSHRQIPLGPRTMAAAATV
jgi:hypothetical protein